MTMIEIKIKDKQWFRKNCVSQEIYFRKTLVPSCWTHEQQMHAVQYCYSSIMLGMAGKVFKVDKVYDNAQTMMDSRYSVDGFWIPNWAIEWVKEGRK